MSEQFSLIGGKMTFCKLEKDKKTFEYVKKYIIYYLQNQEKGFFDLDAQIQADEIKQHLENNHLDDKNQNQEMINWITNNSEKFRMYLNTIKVVFAVWHCAGYPEPFDWDHFCKIVDRMDEIKNSCLDGITND